VIPLLILTMAKNVLGKDLEPCSMFVDLGVLRGKQWQGG